MNALFLRLINRKRPFSVTGSTQRELVLSDGFYTIYLKHWLRYFKPSQVLIVDGSKVRVRNVMYSLFGLYKLKNVQNFYL